ncbi:hypothetical protein [Bradyrhizobium japonicum]|uniref:hypothetical protein n=1 Tax=Bradyrhizobium japonicum TaxID=375 RepID=UPI001BAA343F|nr:hypothetical protein [Bradyrhizobium japonicum]MBR0960880.1 hypothetical protein [Bradyrhizobium japonicum]
MTFQFDPEKPLDENVAAFKTHVSALDPECAAILFDNLDVLLGDGDPTRMRARRGEFNAAVVEALEALPAPIEGKP